MPRGRHRHSPPLHRLLPPSLIAGVSVLCALGAWVVTQPMVLRVLAAAAAVTAIVGAAVMRYWDAQAGARVADLQRARASDEWHFEERVAELESELEESRELRNKLEQRLGAKRAELAGLRNEHASLLRRYAAAETDRASVLEERRMLEIETSVPARALPAAPQPASLEPGPSGRSVMAGDVARAEDVTGAGGADAAAPAVFSPEGSPLFQRADAALSLLAGDTGRVADAGHGHAEERTGTPEATGALDDDTDGATEKDGAGGPSAAEVPAADVVPQPNDSPQGDDSPQGGDAGDDNGPAPGAEAGAGSGNEAESRPEAVSGGAPASEAPASPVRQPTGHFTVPTAVAVVPPATPVRRPAPEGKFDFFGTRKGTDPAAADSDRNTGFTDTAAQEGSALHKTEAEARYKPADERTGEADQVIDLTRHDESERPVRNVRSAVF